MEKFSNKWGRKYPKVVKWWQDRSDELLSFMEFPEEIRAMIYTTDMIERLFKEIKRRLKVMEVLRGEESAGKILYAILKELNNRLMSRKLRRFEKTIEKYHENKRICAMNLSAYEEIQFT